MVSSLQWIAMIKMIANPAHIYGDHNDRMPAFNPPENPESQQLSDEKIGLIVDWIRQDWRTGEPSKAQAAHE